MLICK